MKITSIIKLCSALAVSYTLVGCSTYSNRYNDLATKHNIKITEETKAAQNDAYTYSYGDIIPKNNMIKAKDFKFNYETTIKAIIEVYLDKYSYEWDGKYGFLNNVFERYPKSIGSHTINRFQENKDKYAVTVKFQKYNSRHSRYFYMSFEPIIESNYDVITLKGIKPHIGFICNKQACNTKKGQPLDEWFEIYNNIQTSLSNVNFSNNKLIEFSK